LPISHELHHIACAIDDDAAVSTLLEVRLQDAAELCVYRIVEAIRDLPPDFFAINLNGFPCRSCLWIKVLLRSWSALPWTDLLVFPPFFPSSVKAGSKGITHLQPGTQETGLD
jgi:hypothetical protein